MIRSWIAWLKSHRSNSDQLPRREEIGFALEQIESRGAAIGVVEVSDLSRYQQSVKELPRPSDAQIQNFVEYVSVAHSWYKKLPLMPPGVPFTFFLDPYAGFTRVIQEGGGVLPRERTTDSQGSGVFTTEQYRDQFGYLACDRAGSRYTDMTVGPLGEYGESNIFCVDGRASRIPPEIALVGTTFLTAIIHPRTAQLWVWQRRLPDSEGRSWPAETGGRETVKQILTVCRKRLADRVYATRKTDEEFDSLLSPERKRLQHEMTETISRMLAMSYGDPR